MEFKIADYKIESINDNVSSNDLIPKNIKHMNVTELWNCGYKGEGIVIGILDTGAEVTHNSLKTNFLKGRNFIENGELDDYKDRQGHGTHVTSIACGCPDGVNPGVYGVAPNAKFMIGKVLDDNGNGTYKSVLDGFKWLIDEGVDIINASIGGAG